MSKTAVLEAPHYRETRERLKNDPHVRAMAVSLTVKDVQEGTHEGGCPRHELMGAANREYARRVEAAGDPHNGGHLGAVAEALVELVTERHEAAEHEARVRTVRVLDSFEDTVKDRSPEDFEAAKRRAVATMYECDEAQIERAFTEARA